MDRSRVPLLLSSRRPRVVPYSANAVNFDGSTKIDIASPSLSPSNKLTACGWFNLDGGDNARRTIFRFAISGSVAAVFLAVETDNKLRAYIKSGDGVDRKSSSSFVAGASWHWFFLSYDGAGAAFNMFVDEVDESGSPVVTNGTVDFGWPFAVAAKADAAPPTETLIGCLADLWIAPGVYLAATTDNFRKFRTLEGKPVDLGADGSTPTGAAPSYFFSGATASFHESKGSVGDTGVVTGTLGDCAGTPSD